MYEEILKFARTQGFILHNYQKEFLQAILNNEAIIIHPGQIGKRKVVDLICDYHKSKEKNNG